MIVRVQIRTALHSEMEDLQRKHRQEQKDLQSRIMQKKKLATKKSRKGINDECEALERQLKDKQSLEIHALQNTPDVVSSLQELELSSDVIESENLGGIENAVSSISLTSEAASTGETKKPNRQKARLARRAAEQEAAAIQAAKEAAELPNFRDQERTAMREQYTLRDLKEKEIQPDGHCLYAAVADQLAGVDIDLKPETDMGSGSHGEITANSGYKSTRQVAASYISHHPDDFAPFLEQPIQEYIRTIRDTAEWGGHLELMALAQAYGVTINVLQGDGKVEKITGGKESSEKQLWLAYYRHSFGLGEHYNSLRRIT